MSEEKSNFIPAKTSYKPSRKPAVPNLRQVGQKVTGVPTVQAPKNPAPRAAAPMIEEPEVAKLEAAEAEVTGVQAEEPQVAEKKTAKQRASRSKNPRAKAAKSKPARAKQPAATAEESDGAGDAAQKKASGDLDVRLTSGSIYVAVTAGCLLLCNLSAAIVLAVTAAICAWELFAMLRSENALVSEYLGVLVAAAYPMSVYFWGMAGTLGVTAAYLLILLITYVFDPHSTINDIAVSLFGPLYTGLLLSSVLVIRQGIGGFWGGLACVIILASIWFNDGAAYLVGRKIGKHKMAPKISPKKSWEGFIAGVIVSMVMWCLMLLIPPLEITLTKALICGFVCGIVGVIGDLAESRMKRNAGVKDSGSLMPGHGGLLDRSDSLLLVAAFASILLYLFGCVPISLS